MKFTDTRGASVCADFKTAVIEGMSAQTGGLFIPETYPAYNAGFLESNPSFIEIAYEGAKLFMQNEISDSVLRSIVEDAYPFGAPVVFLTDNTAIVELFHGPTCAFKDFGARFMARVMSFFNKNENETLHILVATSGDTGSAVGSAFQDIPGIDVTILFPAGKISHLQEKQLSTFTGNVRAFRVAGSFDDCQKLVKTAFTDGEVRKKLRLSSANSINISRLLPQSFYYTSAALDVMRNNGGAKVIAVVPSGNFGDLTSGLIAQKMGAPVTGFVAAANANKTIPDWIASGTYSTRPSVQTLSNAMDVGAPSNYERMASMYSLDEFKTFLAAFWLDDAGTLDAIKRCYDATNYLLDPHGAVGYSAWQDILNGGFANITNTGVNNKPGLAPNVPHWASFVQNKTAVGIVLETAHPAKFGETVLKARGKNPALPERLKKVLELPDNALSLPNDYAAFKEILLQK